MAGTVLYRAGFRPRFGATIRTEVDLDLNNEAEQRRCTLREPRRTEALILWVEAVQVTPQVRMALLCLEVW